MPRDLVGQLKGWQKTARGLDEALNPQPDPKVVAAREAAIAEERRKQGRARMSRAQSRKAAFLKEEQERAWARMKPEERAAIQRKSVMSQLNTAIPILTKMFGFPTPPALQ